MDTSLQICTTYALVHLTGMSASASEIYVPIGNDRFSCIVTLAARIRTIQMRSIDSFLCVTHLISFGPFVRFSLLAKSDFKHLRSKRACYSEKL